MVRCLGFHLLLHVIGDIVKTLLFLYINFIHSYSSPLPWRAEMKAQPVQQANFCADVALHCSRAAAGLQAPLSPIDSHPAGILSPVTREREIARQKEQERRRREAVSSTFTSTSRPEGCPVPIMAPWPPNLPNHLVFCLSRCALSTYPCSETSWPCLRWTWTEKANTLSTDELLVVGTNDNIPPSSASWAVLQNKRMKRRRKK